MVLKVESMVAAIPPDALVPIPQNIREEAVIEAADELLHEDEEMEHLPDSRPEEEEAEQADAEQADAEQADAEQADNEEDAVAQQENQQDPNGRMPGQLPTGEQVSRDYHSVKKAAKERIVQQWLVKKSLKEVGKMVV